MDLSINTTKVCLKNTPIFMYKVSGGTQETFMFATIQIGNFFHHKRFKPSSFIPVAQESCFSVEKRKDAIYVEILTENIFTAVECFVFYSYTTVTTPVPGKQISANRYEVRIPLDIIYDSRNENKEKGNLILLLKFHTKFKKDLKLYSFLGKKEAFPDSYDSSYSYYLLRWIHPREEEGDKIGNDLISKWNENFLTDFIILVQAKAIHVHKAILASRSSYFCDYIKKQGTCQIEIDTIYEAMEVVVHFLYSGKLKIEKLNLISVVLELSLTLNLGSLKRLCLDFLKSDINKRNVQQIKETGSKYKIDELVSAADNFIGECTSNRKIHKKPSAYRKRKM